MHTLPMRERIQYYFVDEAGDLNLFDKKGRPMQGTPGVSQFFMVGVVRLPDPSDAQTKLDVLRAQLLSDPYFQGVPSFRPEANKTALFFHAKDDLPEVRREMFKLLPTLGAQVHVALRRKDALTQEAQTLFHYGRKLYSQDVYDDLIMRVFRNLLHKGDSNEIVFARRGKTARKDALQTAIRKAKENFAARWGTYYDKPTTIHSGFPSAFAGLQVIDYYLWALQRLFESGEDRFFNLLQHDFKLIMDLDDTREKPYGAWYTKSNPLTPKKIKPSNRLGAAG